MITSDFEGIHSLPFYIHNFGGLMKKILPILVGVMIIAVGVIGYLVYGEYREYAGEDELTKTQAKMIDSLEELSNYPEGVKNGTVSVDYFKNMMYMINSFTSYSEEIFLAETIDYDNVEEKSRDYLVEMNSLDLLPLTQADSELDNYAMDFKIQSELVAEYMIDYATKREHMYYKMAADYIQDVSNTYKTIEQISRKYDVYH